MSTVFPTTRSTSTVRTVTQSTGSTVHPTITGNDCTVWVIAVIVVIGLLIVVTLIAIYVAIKSETIGHNVRPISQPIPTDQSSTDPKISESIGSDSISDQNKPIDKTVVSEDNPKTSISAEEQPIDSE